MKEDVFSFSSSMDSSLHIRSMRVHYNIDVPEFLEKVKLISCKEDERQFMCTSLGVTTRLAVTLSTILILGIWFLEEGIFY